MNNHDFSHYLETISDSDLFDILVSANKKIQNLELVRKKEEIDQAFDLARKIKSLLFLLNTGRKPASMNNYDLKLVKNLILKLIEKKQLKPEIINVFNSEY